MRRFFLTILMVILSTSTIYAASIDGRLGLTGRAGVLVPRKNNFISGTSESRAGAAFGGGLIYGFCKNFAVELDVSHVPKLDVEISGSKSYEASFTDLSLGIQYRFIPENRFVPYLGIGADFIRGDLAHISGAKYDLDWTAGGHLGAGIDYFINRGIALNADFRGVYTAKGYINKSGVRVGEYYPLNFIGMFGIRFFLPENAFN